MRAKMEENIIDLRLGSINTDINNSCEIIFIEEGKIS